ncbi:hypothetical protein OSTOST_19758, partial [Ostertagia ostertagi]
MFGCPSEPLRAADVAIYLGTSKTTAEQLQRHDDEHDKYGKTISSVLLLSNGHAEGYNCKENVPEKIQVFLANAINSKRKEYNSGTEFDCSLAGEAFTHEYQSKVHDGFHSIVERNLEEAIT